ncbi:MAG: hypothetical protein DMG13_05685 [Acidobacteria bacterium]|nr:MAG: hypothetical protein DMG13_05685 [Acidobacteriota bacterium]
MRSILVASEFSVYRESLVTLLGSTLEFRVVASAEREIDVLRLVKRHRPNVALLDLNGAWLTIYNLVTALSVYCASPLLMRSIVDQAQTLELLRRGARGIISRQISAEMLLKSVRAVGAGEIWISRETTNKLVQQVQLISQTDSLSPPSPVAERVLVGWPEMDAANFNSADHLRNRYNLTRRELQMVQALAGGMTNKDIAIHFGISEFTVKYHLANIFDKVGVYSRLELVMFVTHHGVVDPPRVATTA